MLLGRVNPIVVREAGPTSTPAGGVFGALAAAGKQRLGIETVPDPRDRPQIGGHDRSDLVQIDHAQFVPRVARGTGDLGDARQLRFRQFRVEPELGEGQPDRLAAREFGGIERTHGRRAIFPCRATGRQRVRIRQRRRSRRAWGPPFFALSTSAASSDPLSAFLDRIAERGLSLYPAQEEAILEIFDGRNVILNTPTGSGKSLVAEALHFHSLRRGARSVYTCPIKALV
ncbi:MAG: DEAD/DEAH box helicase, partial [Verrucomicrobia bacterium]|nr:DEAD/DEAH box helicase [Verrucomicrobiota bacterium]